MRQKYGVYWPLQRIRVEMRVAEINCKSGLASLTAERPHALSQLICLHSRA